MPRETMAEVKAQRDDYKKKFYVASGIMAALAHGETPDAFDMCIMPDGTEYRMRVFGVNRAHGGTVLISFLNKGYGNRETFDAQYFEDALIQARKTATASPEVWMYRDAFDRLENKVRKLQQKTA